MPALFYYFDGSKNFRSGKEQNRNASRNEGREDMRYYQSERIDRPYRIVIVVIGIAKFLSVVLGS